MKEHFRSILVIVLASALFGALGTWWLLKNDFDLIFNALVYPCVALIAGMIFVFFIYRSQVNELKEGRENLELERKAIEERQQRFDEKEWKQDKREQKLTDRENYLRDEFRLDLIRELTPGVKEELARQFKKEVNREVRDSKRHMLNRDYRLNLAHRHITKSRVQILELRAARSQLIIDLQKSESENRELSGQVKHLNLIVEQRKNWDNETAMKMVPHLSQSTLLKALHKRKDFPDLKAKLRSGR